MNMWDYGSDVNLNYPTANRRNETQGQKVTCVFFNFIFISRLYYFADELN